MGCLRAKGAGVGSCGEATGVTNLGAAEAECGQYLSSGGIDFEGLEVAG